MPDADALLARRERAAELLDVYGPLLTARQREAAALHYGEDLSLGEIAAGLGVSRQAVHDLLRRTVAALEGYEARLGLADRRARRRRTASALLAALARAREAPGSADADLRQAAAAARRLAEE